MAIAKYMCVALSTQVSTTSKINILILEQIVRGMLQALIDGESKYVLRLYSKLVNTNFEGSSTEN